MDSLRKVTLIAGNILPASSFANSGCTIHFFKHREVFSSYEPLNKVVSQSLKEGISFTILGTSNIELKVVSEGKEHTLMFHDALHAPDITANLLSISKMDFAGLNAVFSNGHVQFFNKDKVEVFGGVLKGGLYLVHGSFNMTIPTALTAWSLQSPTDIDTWHHYFLHFRASRIHKASKLVDGLEIIKKEMIGHCEDYIMANMKHHPFNEVTSEETPLWCTNIDVWGPSCVSSEGGALYAMKFHDSETSHWYSFFLKDRLANMTLEALKTYKLESEKVTGKMVYVCTDNAPKFKSNAWAMFFNENGIIYVPTAPYSSASNGIAKCSIGISTATVLAMLNDSCLLLKWWAEA